jgi:hypothetical protein
MATQAELAGMRVRAEQHARAEQRARDEPESLTWDDVEQLSAGTVSEAMRSGALEHLGLGRSTGKYR